MTQTDPWLTIVGLGEDGPDGLSAASLRVLQEAEVIMGAKRHLGLLRIRCLLGSKLLGRATQ